MSDLTTPNSLKTYFGDATVRTAVDDMMRQMDGSKMPVESWSEQREYHKALLMTAKVRSDYAEFLFKLIDALCPQMADILHLAPEIQPPKMIWDDQELFCELWTNEKEIEWFGFGIVLDTVGVVPFAYIGTDAGGWRPLGAQYHLHGWSEEKPKENWEDCSYGRRIETAKFLKDPSQFITEWSQGLQPMIKASTEQ